MAKDAKNKQIWARFNEEQLALIDAAAEAEGRTRASFIANAVLTYAREKYEVEGEGELTEAIRAEEEE